MNKRLIIFLLILGVIVSPIAFAKNEVIKTCAYIATTGEFEKDILPDVCEISFSIETKDKSSKAALMSNNNLSGSIVKLLKVQLDESKGESIQTINFSSRPLYDTRNIAKKIVTGYEVSNSIKIVVKDLKKVEKIVKIALENGVTRTNSVDFRFEDNSVACNSIYPIATENALSQAKIIAKSLKVNVTGVRKVNASCNVQQNYAPYMVLKSSSDCVESSRLNKVESNIFSPKKVKVKAVINAEFNVK